MHILAAITTAPRPVPTIKECRRTVGPLADWVVEFDDFDSSLGPMANLVRAVSWCVEYWCEPWEWLALAQDDAVFCRNLRRYFELSPPPPGWLSLYTQGSQHRGDVVGWHKPRGMPGGAVAYLVPRTVAERFCEAPPAVGRRNAADYQVGRWCRKNGVRLWLHSPSLVQHIGTTRAIGYKDGMRWQEHTSDMPLDEKRRAKVWCEDAMELLCDDGPRA